MVKPELAAKLVDIAMKQLASSARFKSPWMAKIKKYEEAYAGKVREKIRQTFNVPLPVFSGLVDTLMADLNDPINLKFTENDPADYNAIRKVNSGWNAVSGAMDKESMFQMKLQWDRFNAILSGLGVQKSVADSADGFKFDFNITNYANFHFEPKGGGWLENHLFCGEDGIQRTGGELEDGANKGFYNSDSVEWILDNAGSDEVKKNWEGNKDYDVFSIYRAFGLNPDEDNYVGELIINPVEWCLVYNNKRYYLLFDPWTRKAIRAEELADITESALYPWTAWQTHPNQKSLVSKCYGDDFYPVHDSVGTLLNQELTNRQKKNMGARAYDVEMFPDVSKLDKAAYRPDALVPVNTKGGTRKIGEGIYEFNTPELQGTINLINWLEQDLSKNTGVFEIQNQQSGKGKATVQYALLQQAQKRLTEKNISKSICYQQIGLRFLWGLKEHLTGPMAVQLTGPDGYGWDELRKSELNFRKRPNVTIINLTEQDKDNVLGKDQKIKAISQIAESEVLLQQVNPKWVAESILRDIGGYDDTTIQTAMDVQNFANKDVMAEAERVIQEMVNGKMPEPVYTANIAFLRRILDFVKTHQVTLKDKAHIFFDYIQQMGPIVMENMMSIAQQLKLNQGMGGGQEVGQMAGQPQPQPTPQPQGGQPVANQRPTSRMGAGAQVPQMADMAVGGGGQ